MICPSCGSDNAKVTDSMSGNNGLSIYRRRKCLVCNSIFRTVETVDDGSDAFQAGYLAAVENKSLLIKTANERRRV